MTEPLQCRNEALSVARYSTKTFGNTFGRKIQSHYLFPLSSKCSVRDLALKADWKKTWTVYKGKSGLSSLPYLATHEHLHNWLPIDFNHFYQLFKHYVLYIRFCMGPALRSQETLSSPTLLCIQSHQHIPAFPTHQAALVSKYHGQNNRSEVLQREEKK